MSATCEDCRFWDAGFGYCRRYAPRGYVVPENAEMQVNWPAVKSTDWCGEHAPSLPKEGES